MRYREEQAPVEGAQPAGHTEDFVALTVWLTLLIGIVFVAGGLWGRQRWLTFWGVLTLLACAVYYARGWLGSPF
jgi:hypothetical protein